MNNKLEDQLKEECKFFAETIELERHRGIDLTPIYQEIEQELITKYNTTRNHIKAYVLEEQINILDNNTNYLNK